MSTFTALELEDARLRTFPETDVTSEAVRGRLTFDDTLSFGITMSGRAGKTPEIVWRLVSAAVESSLWLVDRKAERGATSGTGAGEIASNGRRATTYG